MIYGKKSVTWPPLHIALCYNLGWNGPIPNFFSFRATKRLFISKWGRISSEIEWCCFKLVWTLHIALCYNLGWNGPFSNFFSFRATERLFISKWGRISPESQWCWFKLVLGSSFELWVTQAPSNSQQWNYEWQWRHLTVNNGTISDIGAI